MSKSLVIVESPTKARTLSRILGDEFVVESSVGHVRDLPDKAQDIPPKYKKLPWSRLGIDIESEFRPLYVVPSAKKEQVAKLKARLKDAEVLYLATDGDREGESISWHLQAVLAPRVPTHRLVFHEITATAIRKALDQPREIDQRLVRAQEARRVLDRLYGYEISPLLWRKIAPSLSAGRVQSVAIRLIVQREQQRMAFRSAEFWDLSGLFRKIDDGKSSAGASAKANGSPDAHAPFEAVLQRVDRQRLASGKDFDPQSGALREGSPHLHLDAAAAAKLRGALASASWRVGEVERKGFVSKPPPPFTTSTLQQEGSRKLRLGARDTMRIAQSLYEQGLITYMRTDSTTLSDEALKAARSYIGKRYGADYLPSKARQFAAKVKNAQEAHEAIRPTGETFRLPQSLNGEVPSLALKLYELIWKRTIASQMTNARGERMQVPIEGTLEAKETPREVVFQAQGKRILFPGFLKAYVEGSDDPEGELGDQERILPPLTPGEPLRAEHLEARQHHTQPPARFTEASLIRTLEGEGIGRPSTYASIVDTIFQREYAVKKGMALLPTFTAFVVVRLLEEHFAPLVDVQFTAHMENALDSISNGRKESLPFLRSFYFGDAEQKGLTTLLKAEIDPRTLCAIELGEDSHGEPITLRVGRYGPFLEQGERRASLPKNSTPESIDLARAEVLLQTGNEGRQLGVDAPTGEPICVKVGPYGPYVQRGTKDSPKSHPVKMKSLLPEQDPQALTLEEAQQLLSLPRLVGVDPQTEEEVHVDLGRYGPYARRGRETRNLESAEALFSVDLPTLQRLFATKKGGRRQATKKVLRTLGSDAEGQQITLYEGRFGPYVSDGSTNASLPRGTDGDALTLDDALNLIVARQARGPSPKAAARRKTTAKTTGKTAAKATSKTGSRTKQANGSGSRSATPRSTSRRSTTSRRAAQTDGGESAATMPAPPARPALRKRRRPAPA